MALWEKVQQLPQGLLNQVKGTYGVNLPLAVRHHCAEWIESQSWKDIDETNPSHVQNASQLGVKFLELVEAKINDNALDFHVRLELQSYALQIKNVFLNQPLDLIRAVRDCLSKEETIVSIAEALTPGAETSVQATPDKTQEIEETIDVLDKKTKETDEDINQMQLMQEKFVVENRKLSILSGNLTYIQQQPASTQRTEKEIRLQQEKQEMNRQLLASAQKIFHQRQEVAKKMKITLATLEILVNRVVDDELVAWKQGQKLSLNGAPFDTTMIDVLQKWYESLADIIWRNRMQLIKVEGLRRRLPIDAKAGITDLQPILVRIVNGLLTKLVKNSLVVEHQPPQVLKKDSRFTAKVRMLVGGKLYLQLNPPTVKATIFSEQEARRLFLNEVESPDEKLKCGNILNDSLQMNYDDHSGQLSVTYRTMTLQKIKRADKKGAGANASVVAEEKFGICFSTDFKVGETPFDVWTLSLPVVVTVHVNQECESEATIVWDNHFSEPRRIPFEVPVNVPWADVAKMLSMYFCTMTGRGLSDGNLVYLGNKLFGTSGRTDFSSAVVTWAQYFKEKMPGRQFTFWEWFRSACKLVKDHLKAPWTSGYIIGFMDKTEATNLLLSMPSGTFLLRFSDGSSGGITIAWVLDQPDKLGEKQVWNLEPFTTKDFAIRGLADRIKDLVSLVALYPAIPKDTAFPSTSASTQNIKPGEYVKTTLVNVIQGQPPTQQHSAVMDLDNPQTPRAYQGPSPPQSPSSMVAPQADSTLMDFGADGDVCDFLDMDTSEWLKDEFNVDINGLLFQ